MDELYITLFTAYCARHKGACTDEQVEAMARAAKSQAEIAGRVFREEPKRLKGEAPVGLPLREREEED